MALTPAEKQELADLEELERLEAEEASFQAQQRMQARPTGRVAEGVRTGLTGALRGFGVPAPERLARGIEAGFRRTDEQFTGLPEQAGQFLGRFGPSIAASTAAGALLAGPPGAGVGFLRGVAAPALAEAGGAALGEFGGQAIAGQKLQPRQALSAGIGAAVPVAAIRGLGKALSSPAARKLGTQLLASGPRIPPRFGEAVLRDPEILARAENPALVSQAYEAFEQAAGLKGLGKQMTETGKLPSDSAMFRKVTEVARKVFARKPVNQQDLYTASQMATQLKLKFPVGVPERRQAWFGIVVQGKKMIDDTLESLNPGYRQLRTRVFESKAGQAFGEVFPRNLNMSPNKLAMTAAALGLGAGAATGAPGLLLSPLLISPRAAGLGIQAGSRAKKLLGPLAAPFGRALGISSSQPRKNQIPLTP